MSSSPSLETYFPSARPVLVLAPMQDVTDLPFWKVMHHYGGPDIYFTEYFRVHSTSRPEKHILDCIRHNPSGRPAIAQVIGQSLPDLERTAHALLSENIVAIDLNVGCPAPIICRKSSGGGLLRHLDKLDAILRALRQVVTIPLSVKTRVGFHDTGEFDGILDLLSSHPIDMLTLHGRTVREMYRAHVHYDLIAQAAARLTCPVLANGNILSATIAHRVHQSTGVRGLMIGRGAIRNPWIWSQIRELYELGKVITQPTLRDLRHYIEHLFDATRPSGLPDRLHVAKMKKYMNFIAQGVGPDDLFVQEIRRVREVEEFFACCDRHLHSDDPFDGEPVGGALVNSGNPRENCHKPPRLIPVCASPVSETSNGC